MIILFAKKMKRATEIAFGFSTEALPEKGLGSLIVEQFSAIGGVELDIPTRSAMRAASMFESMEDDTTEST